MARKGIVINLLAIRLAIGILDQSLLQAESHIMHPFLALGIEFVQVRLIEFAELVAIVNQVCVLRPFAGVFSFQAFVELAALAGWNAVSWLRSW